MSPKTLSQLFFKKRLPSYIRESVRLIFLFALCAGMTFPQETEAVRYARAVKAVHEADRLFDTGSKDSFRQAIKKYEEAGEIFRSLNQRKNEDLATSSIARSHIELGEFRRAIDAYSLVLKIRIDMKDDKGTALALTHIGSAYHQLKELRRSVDSFTRALEIWRAMKDLSNEALTLTNLCYIYRYDELNEKQKAIERCSQALPLWRRLNDKAQEAYTQYQLGLTYAAMDEDEKAIYPYNQALLLYQKLKERKGEADTLHRIAMAHGRLGKPEKALDYYNLALPIFRETKDAEGLSGTLDNMALIYSSSGSNEKALELYDEALRLAREAKDHQGEGAVLSNIGLTYSRMGQNEKALEYYQKALALKQYFGDRGLEAAALNGIGLVYRNLGDAQKARSHYLDALKISREVGDRTGQVNRLFNLSRLDARQNDFPAARAHVEEAIAIIESLRSAISDKELRTSYFSTVQYYYDFYIEILMRLHEQRPSEGHDGEALQVSERKRARALLETLVEAGSDIRQGVEADLLERERSLQKQLNVSAQTQMKLLSGRHTEKQAANLAKEIQTLTAEFQQVEAEIRKKSPNYAALTQPQPLSLKEIQTKVLDPDTLLLEYSLGSDRSYLWAVTVDSIHSYELPTGAEIENSARRVYDLVNARNKRVVGETREQWQARVDRADTDIPAAAAALSRIVLAPVAAQLGKKRLAIVADGILQYIPFAFLPAPSSASPSATPQALIVAHEIVSLPSASTLAVIRSEVAGRRPAPKMVVALADPVFMKDDGRVKGGVTRIKGNDQETLRLDAVKELELVEAAADTGVAGAGLNVPRLPGTRQEAEEIIAMVPASERKLALDFAANREMATNPQLSQYRYIHFSTHGFLNSVHPELSGLVFSLVRESGESQDGFLRAHEVFNLKLPAELVVLSACQTGIGKEIKGEGLVSLTRGFMYAGSPRVVVSLWSVSELGTTELMVRFYRKMLKEGLRPSAALRAAQVSLMKEKRWSSPFYWAPFTLQGEWR